MSSDQPAAWIGLPRHDQLSSEPGCGQPFLVLAGLIFLAVSVAMGVGFGINTWAALTFVVPLVVGLLLIAAGLRAVVTGMRIAAPEVFVSSKKLRSGEQFTLSYRQVLKRAADVDRILFQLVLRETVRSGYEHPMMESDDNVVQQFESSGRHYQAGEAISDRIIFRIPENAMNTFVTGDRRIQWFVKASVEVAGWPDFQWESEALVR